MEHILLMIVSIFVANFINQFVLTRYVRDKNTVAYLKVMDEEIKRNSDNPKKLLELYGLKKKHNPPNYYLKYAFFLVIPQIIMYGLISYFFQVSFWWYLLISIGSSFIISLFIK